ncbi:MAG: hypothetical protein AABX73_00990 [Nanoarchaeota archaeon]
MKKRDDKKLILLLLIVFASLMHTALASPGFEVGSVLLKSSLTEGESVTKSFAIASGEGGEFSLDIGALSRVKLSEESFTLQKGESKTIDVTFDSEKIKPGIYIGSIAITEKKEVEYLPLIYEVESKDVFFDANLDIPPAYTEVQQGSKVIAQIKIFDLTSGGETAEKSLSPVSIDVEYTVAGLFGNVLSSESEKIVVNKQAQITKTINFPEDIEEGTYVISAVVKYKESVGVSSQTFAIVKKEENAGSSSLFNFSDYGVLIGILIAGGVIILGIILLFVYIIHERSKFVLELRRYNTEELKHVKEILGEQEKMLRNREHPKIRYIKKDINKKVEKLRKVHQKRIEEFKDLDKKGNIKEMKEKLEEWKRKGYNTLPLEYKIKELSTEEMESIMKKWKKKYKF